MEDDIFGVDAGAEFAVDVNAADFELGHRHGLGGEEVADLGGADAESDRAEGAVGGGVRVAAGDGRAGLGDALFWADDVDDALFAAGDVEVGDVELFRVPGELGDHGVGERVIEGLLGLVGGDDVVDGGEGALRVGDLEAEVAHHAKCLRRGDLVDEVGADEELGLAVG